MPTLLYAVKTAEHACGHRQTDRVEQSKKCAICHLPILPMLEQLPLLLVTPIAKAILDKFYEGLGSELSKKAAELPATLITKVQHLGQRVWETCLRGKPGTDKLLETAADESKPESAAAQKQLTEYLYKVLESDAALKQEMQTLAAEIHQDISIGVMNGSEVWNVFGGKAEKNEFTDNKAPVFKDVSNSPITFNNYYGNNPG